MLVKTSMCPPPIAGSIWASAEAFKEIPIFYAAICTVHHKLQLKPEDCKRSLSGSYAQCSKEPENWGAHLNALMKLPGIFAENEEQKVDKNGRECCWYGYADAFGITINSDLLNRACHIGRIHPNDWMSQFDGVAVFALLQQTVEHELGHIMNHHHCLEDPDFLKKTPEKEPLWGESGFHVQEMAQRRASKTDPKKRGYKAFVLECQCPRFQRPLKGKVYFASYSSTDTLKKPETVEELTNYMDSYHQFVLSSPPEPRRKGKRTLQTSSTSKVESTPVKKTSRRDKVSPGMAMPLELSTANKKDPNQLESQTKQTSTGMDWTDRHDGHPSDDDVDLRVIFDSWNKCDISATFCGEDRVPRDQFVTGEPVYVELNFTNKTEGTAYIQMDYETFRRQGIRFTVEGLTHLYITSYYGSRDSVVVALSEGESYSFFRLLCWGDADSAKKRNIGYAAPDKAGDYTGVSLAFAGEERMLPTCTLKVVGGREEVPCSAAETAITVSSNMDYSRDGQEQKFGRSE